MAKSQQPDERSIFPFLIRNPFAGPQDFLITAPFGGHMGRAQNVDHEPSRTASSGLGDVSEFSGGGDDLLH